jgi:hypothetical protein
MTWISLGLGAYALNVAVGLMAQFGGRSFGVWHHVLYAVVFATAILAIILAFHPALVVTLGALAAFPKARPRTPLHPTLAAVGLLGYLLTFIV